MNVDDDEKEEDLEDDAVAKVHALLEKEKSLKGTYESGLEESLFEKMHDDLNLKERDALRNQSSSKGMYGPGIGESPTNYGSKKAFTDFFRRLQFPSEVRVKRAYDQIFKGVDSKKDSTLTKNQQLSEPFNPPLSDPSESAVNTMCNDATQASTSTAPVIINDDYDKTPSPPPHKSPIIPTPKSTTTKPENAKEKSPSPQPEADQAKPSSSPPEHALTKSPSPPPEHAQTKSPSPPPEQAIQNKPSSPPQILEQNLPISDVRTSPEPTNKPDSE
jgi:hypothetical protein